MLRRAIYRTLRRFGWDLHRVARPHQGLAWLVDFLKREKISLVFDVGANAGQFARGLRQSGYGGRIVSFEPLAEAHEELKKYAAADPEWTIAERMALGADDRELTIHVSRYTEASSVLPASRSLVDMLPEAGAVRSETVPCRRLDTVGPEYLRAGDRVLLKIDVQGYEQQVLDGTVELLPKISGVYAELSIVPLYEGQSLAGEVLDYLERRGLEIWYMRPGFLDPRNGRMLQYDALLLRRSDGNRG